VSKLFCFIIFIPLILVVLNSYQYSDYWNHIKEFLLFKYTFSTLILVIGVGILSLIFGVGAAWIVSVYEFYGRKVIQWLLIIPLTIPTYIIAYSYYDILDYFSPIFIWVRENYGSNFLILIDSLVIYSVVISLFTFVLYPYVYLSTKASLSIQCNRLIEAAYTLKFSPFETFFKVMLPVLKPAIIAGLSLVIMETLNDYGAVEYFGISTLTIGIFRSWFGMNDLTGAIKISTFLLSFVFLFLILERILRGNERYNNKTGTRFRLNRISLSKKKTALVWIFCCTPIIFGFVIPFTRLISWAFYVNLDSSNLDIIGSTLNTVLLSIISAFLITFFAFFINFTKNFYNNQFLKKLGFLTILGYSMPGAIIAIGILNFDRLLSNLPLMTLTGTIFGLTFAYIIRFLAVAWQPLEASMEKQCLTINQAARLMKRRIGYSIFKINIPILKKPILLSVLLVFIDITKELPLTLILRPFNFDTLSTLTYDLIKQANFFQSSLSSLLIILISFPALLAISKQVNEPQ